MFKFRLPSNDTILLRMFFVDIHSSYKDWISSLMQSFHGMLFTAAAIQNSWQQTEMWLTQGMAGLLFPHKVLQAKAAGLSEVRSLKKTQPKSTGFAWSFQINYSRKMSKKTQQKDYILQRGWTEDVFGILYRPSSFFSKLKLNWSWSFFSSKPSRYLSQQVLFTVHNILTNAQKTSVNWHQAIGIWHMAYFLSHVAISSCIYCSSFQSDNILHHASSSILCSLTCIYCPAF